MKKLASLALALALAGCSPSQLQTVKTVTEDVLSATEFACVLDHELDPVPSGSTAGQAIAVVCGIEPNLAATIDKFLTVSAMHRAAVARDAGK